ncbi:glycosyl transferase family protein [Fibrella aestuarina BUZ 2]|uniref:Glycosyl transferase family protein n=1 Tax=Fibrella aestuarina BUZ 2 TaxID=1166018 RepID=I0KH58_9BACT|nr:glycosyltransferase family 2 protein [Fibrella aestuarina]CCH03461.1 glycosyl transferase family protein [Fibrella aestuarina BUZ 2]
MIYPPLVSIVIPLYNQQLVYFQEALLSALAQTYAPLEVIVSDNHSTNEVPAWLATQTDPRLRVVKPERFLPMVEHFQFAADQAQGDWILYLCSDDYLYPDCVETLVAQLPANDRVVVAYGELASVDFRDLDQIKFFYNRKPTGIRTAAESLNELIRQRPFFAWIPGGMIRRDAYRYCRDVLDGHITYGFDVALLLKAHELGQIAYVNKPTGKFRIWTAKEGKLGGNRLIKNIIDAGQCIQLVTESTLLAGYVGDDAIAEWRQYQARRWELAALIDYFTGGCTASEAKDALAIVTKQIGAPSAFTRFVTFLLSKPQAALTRPLLNSMYGVYLRLQKVVKRPF